MWPGWIASVWRPQGEGQAAPGAGRDRLSLLLALVTMVGLSAAFVLSKGTQILMPGPLASAHGGIEKCGACHTTSGSGKLSWMRGLVAGDPHADSKACLTCHKMPDTAFNAHGASTEALKQSTTRLTKVAARSHPPPSARAQDIAFPMHDVVARGLYCATCHQEHQGVGFNLSKISNEQCRSCHVVKFDSFDGDHPKFDNYPFKRRTPIVYDHAGHFGKHYPEVAKKDPARRIPETCSTCHTTRDDRRVMAVAPFEQTCTGCHLNQIVGKERVSGPKGIAFLSLPGLDLQTLKKKSAVIGEWPDASDAALTPFMKVMISRNERGRALVKAVDGLNLQDLSQANAGQIKAVTNLVWEIKRLFYALIKGKASDVLGNLNIASDAKLSPSLVADLTASIPRDVVASAQQEWLPGLAAEMANRPDTDDPKQSGWDAVTTEPKLSGPASGDAVGPGAASPKAPSREAAGETDTANVKPDEGKKERPANELPPAMRAGIGDAEKEARPDGADVKTYTTNAGPDDGSETPGEGPIGARVPLPSGTSRAIDAARNKDAEKAGEPEGADSKSDAAKTKSEDRKPDEQRATGKPAQPEGSAGGADTAKAKPDGGAEAPPANEQPQSGGAAQTDDLLFPTEEELRAVKAGNNDSGKAGKPEAAPGKADAANVKADGAANADAASGADTNAPAPASVEPRTKAVPVIAIESDVDPESWADYGGWYRQDYAIFYRPTGHKDKFIYSWLFLTGPQAPKGDTSAAAAVFDALTGKDAQGSCTKCHSVDDIQGKGRVVNFSPPSAESKRGRFTKFIHEPHFGILEDRGCLTCHKLEKGRPYLKSYEQGNPQNFVSNFGAVKKDLCQTCHTSGMARQDCLLCHDYHVNGVVTPIMSTKLPTQ